MCEPACCIQYLCAVLRLIENNFVKVKTTDAPLKILILHYFFTEEKSWRLEALHSGFHDKM